MAHVTSRSITVSLIILSTCAVLLVLVEARRFLIPIVIALLATGVMSFAIDRLRSYGFPRWLAIASTASAVVIGLYLVVSVLYGQTATIAARWPAYASRVSSLISDLTNWAGPNVSAGLADLVERIDLARAAASVAGSAGAIFGSMALIALYAGFLLAERGTMARKLIALIHDLEKAEEYREVHRKLSDGLRRYLWVKTLMSLVTGGLCYIILKFYGVDFAEFWGMLIFLLNFIPNIGSIAGVVFPAILTLLQFDTIWIFVQVSILMGTVQIVVGNIIEPRYMGKTLNLSPFVVILSLTFWGTIWGIEGMFLSVPLTASIAIVCANIPALNWIAILLSAEGELETLEKLQGRRTGQQGIRSKQ